jgi:hypothetical protein
MLRVELNEQRADRFQARVEVRREVKGKETQGLLRRVNLFDILIIYVWEKRLDKSSKRYVPRFDR